MPINARQFIAISEHHQGNLNKLLAQYAELPEGPGILLAMMYIQQSINKARTVTDTPASTNELDKTED